MRADILPHHRATIQNVISHFQADRRILALIVGGSVMKGLARPDSDVDVMLIVPEEDYAACRARHEILFHDTDLPTYAGGLVEGKYLTPEFLAEAAVHGSEPTRFSFLDAFVAFSRLPDLERTIQDIVTYPDREQPAKLLSFLSQVGVMHWYVKEAERRRDAYLLAQSAAGLALFAGRAILAHNRILFPGHKWFMVEVQRAPDKPEGFVELLEAALREPGSRTSRALFDSVVGFRDWGITEAQAVTAYIEDTERAWLGGRPALADW